MTRYLINRIILSVFTFFAFVTIVYFLMDLQPGSFANIYLSDPNLTPAQREILSESLGLNRPVHERYFIWMGNMFKGDLGISFSNYPRPVSEILIERAPRTLMLFITATVVSWYSGFLAGKLLAWRRGGLFEYLVTVGGVTLYTVFTPWFGLMMIWLFAFQFDMFPTGKFLTPTLWRQTDISANSVFLRLLLTLLVSGIALLAWLLFLRRLDPVTRKKINWIGPLLIVASGAVYWFGMTGTQACSINVEWAFIDWAIPAQGASCYMVNMLYHLTLPIFVVTLISFAGTMLLTRNSMLETLREDYILTARAKGLPEKVIRDKHAARNAMLPVVTALVFSLAFALDGGVITETIFSWPGMGLTLVTAAQVEDIPMVVGALVFTGSLVLMAHLVADILYAYLDPRIRYS